MDLEHLNKSQIVLLTMLVSFVTSIATGIVTVALIEETPSDVTRVVQRVVERTVETVAPSETQQATVITKEKTVIVKEADLIAVAVSENTPKIVSVLEADTGAFVSLGFFINASGTIAVDASTLTEGGKYVIDVGAEEKIPATVTSVGQARGVALLTADAARITTPRITPSELKLALGQTVVAFIGGGSITQGIVTGLGEGGYIGTSIPGAPIAPGALLINVDGEVIGMSTGASRKVTPNSFVPIRAVLAQAVPSEEATGETPAGTKPQQATSTTPATAATQ